MSQQGTLDTIALDHSLRSLSRHLATLARVLMGLVFFVFGLNGFFNFIPPPSTALPENAMAFATGLMKAGYFFPLLKGTETLVGALLLANRFVPLALAIIAPVVINILAFHAFLERSDLAIPIGLVVCEVYLAYAHRRAFAPLFRARHDVVA